ncbi:MAG: T9SS type A sorting domain-containing protein [Flavobacteriales bacterium]|nr:T9SS type A sorting domain-containing protein [Flavobacteriales bacterium]
MDWAPVGAKWWYEASWAGWNAWGITYYNLDVVGEAEVQGIMCRELSWNDHGAELCLGCDLFEEVNYFVYSDSGRVHCFNYETDAFGLLYDMNKGIGESWEVDFPFNSEEPGPLIITVIDTMSIVVNGTRLRQQKTDFPSAYERFYFGDTITEGIGGNWSFLPQCSMHMVCELSYGNLRCYEDSTLGQVQFSEEDCEYTYVGIDETDTNAAMADIWPNPTSGPLTITSTKPLLTVAVVDMLGRVLLSEGGESSNTKAIDLSHLPAGIYVVHVETEAGRHVQRVVRD